LPVCSGREATGAFEREGWIVARYIDDHFILKKKGVRFLLSIPDHKPVKSGTLRRLVRDADLTVDRDADLTVDRFVELLGKGSKKEKRDRRF